MLQNYGINADWTAVSQLLPPQLSWATNSYWAPADPRMLYSGISIQSSPKYYSNIQFN